MATGRTPTIDSLNSYKHCWIRFGRGTIYDEVYGSTISLHSSSLLNRNGAFIIGTNISTVAIPDFTAGAPINVFMRVFTMGCDGTSTPTFCHKINTTAKEGFRLLFDSSLRLFAQQYMTDDSIVSSSVSSAGTVPLWQFSVISFQAQSNSANGVQAFLNGISAGAAGSTAGKTIRHRGSATPFRILGYATSQNIIGIVSDILIFQNIVLTASQHLAIASELSNELKYETSPIVVNSGYPTYGSSVWEARFGILAGEVTMSAGSSIGQLNDLRVVSGTHKCSTELYGTKLAKTIVCVTNGTVRLPDPRPELGTTFAFKKYTGGAWTDATSGSTDIALTAGEKILLATQDASVCLRKY